MEKSKRRIIFIGSLMTALLVWLCPWGSIVANATGDFSDYDYYGRIDSFTGEPINDTITDGDNTIITDSSRKYITGNEYYDSVCPPSPARRPSGLSFSRMRRTVSAFSGSR